MLTVCKHQDAAATDEPSTPGRLRRRRPRGSGAALDVGRIDDDDRQVDAIVEAVSRQTVSQVVAALEAKGVAVAQPAGRNVHAFMNDPEQRRIGRVAELPHATKGNVRELHVLLRVSDAEQVPHRLAPELGQHTDEILTQFGYTADEITELRADSAIRRLQAVRQSPQRSRRRTPIGE